MAVTFLKNLTQVHQSGIADVINSAKDIPNTTVTFIKDGHYIKNIFIRNKFEFVSDVELEYCNGKKHYRVYFLVADREHVKQRSGYAQMTIGSKLAAAELVSFLAFIYRHRANSKE